MAMILVAIASPEVALVSRAPAQLDHRWTVNRYES